MKRYAGDMVGLNNKNVLCVDSGLYIYSAQKLGESFGSVRYHRLDTDPYPRSEKSQIGEGLPEIEVVKDFWPHLDWADLIYFPDCYQGEMQHSLREKGYRVFGAGLSARMELDKEFFLETIDDLGLPVSHTYRAEGLGDLVEHLTGVKDERYLKCSHRGDFETKKYTGMKQLENWLGQYLRPRIGERAKDIEILVQDPIEAECEIGYDGFRVDGVCTENCMLGYEIKDLVFAGKVFDKPPKIIADVNDALTPIYKQLGYRGHYSNELRITKGGDAYLIDETCRMPSPPGGVLCEIYGDSYAQAVWDISGGEMPKLKATHKFGAEVILNSSFLERYQLCVEFPKSISRWIKLKNHFKRDGAYYVVPSENAGYFGSAVGLGDTVKEACEKAMGVAKQVICTELELDESAFKKADEQIGAGRAFGIDF